MVGANTYVFLGFTTVRKDEATMFYRGDLVTYHYPTGLMDATKNKISLYVNGALQDMESNSGRWAAHGPLTASTAVGGVYVTFAPAVLVA